MINASATIAPIVTIINGTPVTTSLDIAQRFNKRHDNVVRAIENLKSDCPAEFHLLNFEEVIREYENGKGGTQQAPAYKITRDGFTLLAMGFTGKRALQFKLAYIAAFNAMEAQLHSAQTPALTEPMRLLFTMAAGEVVRQEVLPPDALVISEHRLLAETRARFPEYVLLDRQKAESMANYSLGLGERLLEQLGHIPRGERQYPW